MAGRGGGHASQQQGHNERNGSRGETLKSNRLVYFVRSFRPIDHPLSCECREAKVNAFCLCRVNKDDSAYGRKPVTIHEHIVVAR